MVRPNNTISIEKGGLSVEQAKRVNHMQPVLVPFSHKMGNHARPEPALISTKTTSPMLTVAEHNKHRVGVEGAEVEGIFNTFRADG